MAKTKHKVKTWAEQRAYEKVHGKFQGRGDWIKSLINTGLTQAECGRMCNINPGQLSLIASQFELKFKRGRLGPLCEPIDPEKIRALLKQGLTHREISERLKISPSTVGAKVDRYFPELKRGVPKKPRPKQTPVTQDAPERPLSPLEKLHQVAAHETVARRLADQGLWR